MLQARFLSHHKVYMPVGHEPELGEDDGLPRMEALIPLTQTLITPALACAFQITPHDKRAGLMEHIAPQLQLPIPSQSTLRSCGVDDRGAESSPSDAGEKLDLNLEPPLGAARGSFVDNCDWWIGSKKALQAEASGVRIVEATRSARRSESPKFTAVNGVEISRKRSSMAISEGSYLGDDQEVEDEKKRRKNIILQEINEVQEEEELESGDNWGDQEDIEARTRAVKRARLVWTPQLHKRFVDAVVHLGMKNAVPKTIMQLMNVDGLTRENVASHLQKYRLYLKRTTTTTTTTSTHASSSANSSSDDHLCFHRIALQLPGPSSHTNFAHHIFPPPSPRTNFYPSITTGPQLLGNHHHHPHPHPHQQSSCMQYRPPPRPPNSPTTTPTPILTLFPH